MHKAQAHQVSASQQQLVISQQQKSQVIKKTVFTLLKNQITLSTCIALLLVF